MNKEFEKHIERNAEQKRAVVLLSGGLDSALCLGLARTYDWECHCLIVDYDQRNAVAETGAARWIAAHYQQEMRNLRVDLSGLAPSPLTGLPQVEPRTLGEIREAEGDSPYVVPGRNLILLSLANALADSLGISVLVIGANLEDWAGFPDCRPEFFDAFEKVSGKTVIHPLTQMRKQDVAWTARKLGVPIEKTVSCYYAKSREHCGRCDACMIRREAFELAGVEDSTVYAGGA